MTNTKKLLLFIVLFITLIFVSILFHNKLIESYFSYKLSKWVERKVFFKKFVYDYPDTISITGLQIVNKKPNNYKNIFYAEEIDINFNLKSFIFSDLVIINKIKIVDPEFFLEIFLKNNQLEKLEKGDTKIIVEDNIGLAKKVNENLPDKVWPKKIRDVNFLIIHAELFNAKAFLKISTLSKFSKVNLSNFKFYKIGNHEKYNHYKKALELMFFDMYARLENKEKKNILKKIYKL